MDPRKGKGAPGLEGSRDVRQPRRLRGAVQEHSCLCPTLSPQLGLRWTSPTEASHAPSCSPGRAIPGSGCMEPWWVPGDPATPAPPPPPQFPRDAGQEGAHTPIFISPRRGRGLGPTLSARSVCKFVHKPERGKGPPWSPGRGGFTQPSLGSRVCVCSRVGKTARIRARGAT